MSTPTRIDDLRVFVQIVRDGNLSGAARSLRRTPNAVSRSLIRLEADMGLPLCLRTTRSLTTTKEGLRLYASAVRVLSELSELEAELTTVDSLAVGSVSVRCPPALATSRFMAMLAAFIRANPNLQIQLSLSDDPVPSSVFDVVLYAGRPPDSDLVARRLGEARWLLCATPDYLEEHGTPEHPTDLTAHHCLRYSGGLPQTVWQLERDDERVDIRVGGALECDDSRALGDAVRAGIGIGIRPRGELKQAVASGSLVEVLPGWTFGRLPLYVLSPPNVAVLPRVKEVRHFLARAVQHVL